MIFLREFSGPWGTGNEGLAYFVNHEWMAVS